MSNTRSKGDLLFRSHNRLVELAQTRPPVPAWEQAMRQFGERFFEAAPGLVTWILLLAPAWIPIIFHSTGALFVASVVLVFDAYWVLRAIGVVTGVYGSMLKLRRDGKRDWLALCREEAAQGRLDPLQFLHLSVIPTYTEPYHVLERTVQAIRSEEHTSELQSLAYLVCRLLL